MACSQHPRTPDPAVCARNIRMMHLLERIALAFNEGGVPLMVLKGAALNLTLYQGPGERPMGDLDLLVRPEHAGDALTLLERLGCTHGRPLVREDFFPRFHYEVEYTAGSIYPVKIDLHVRPFRPLRYSRLMPDQALWQHAEPVPIGRATVLVPSAEDLLIHLAVHAAIHGNNRRMWLAEMRRWVEAQSGRLNWGRFVDHVQAWGLALPVLSAIQRVEGDWGPVCPPDIRQRLSRIPVGWQDRLALRQAPRDAAHPVAHAAVDVLCTPGWRFPLAYLWAVAVPSRAHIEDWYYRRHRGWLPCAYVLRALWPIAGRIRRFSRLFTNIETRNSPIHGLGVFVTRDFQAGELIARYRGKRVDRDGVYVVQRETASGEIERCEITGKLKYLNHCCRPNAKLSRVDLVAIKPIRAGQEITIDYGPGACNCRRTKDRTERRSPQDAVTDAA